MSAAGKRLWADPAFRAKMIAARTGKKRGPYRRSTDRMGTNHHASA
jgi:hypothetical protein